MLTETGDSEEREGHAAYAERKKERKENPKTLSKPKPKAEQHNTTKPI